MCGGTGMAMFAAHSRTQFIERKLPVGDAPRSVATEAGRDFSLGGFAPHGFHQVVRTNAIVAHGNTEALHVLVVSHQALVKSALIFEHKREVVKSEGVLDGERELAACVANGVLAEAVLA